MRISDNRAVGAARKSSKKTRVSDGGTVFSLSEPENTSLSRPAAAIASPVAVGNISSLLAVQGALDDESRSAALKQGFNTLDILDSLKLDVLTGYIPRQRLVNLATIVEKQRADAGDPALVDLLDHIELRARVELAKYEHSRR